MFVLPANNCFTRHFADQQPRQYRSVFGKLTKSSAVIALGVLLFAALGPADWQWRTGLGFQVDHFIALFAITSIVCLAWPRPFVVGGALAVASALLEGLQVLTPDRVANLEAAVYGSTGAMAAALLFAFFIRVRKWRLK